jgi:hypothetical protein
VGEKTLEAPEVLAGRSAILVHWPEGDGEVDHIPKIGTLPIQEVTHLEIGTNLQRGLKEKVGPGQHLSVGAYVQDHIAEVLLATRDVEFLQIRTWDCWFPQMKVDLHTVEALKGVCGRRVRRTGEVETQGHVSRIEASTVASPSHGAILIEMNVTA